METLTTSAKKPELVTNLEVMKILEGRINTRNKNKDDKKHRSVRHRDWIESNLFRYLERTPCAKTDLDKMPKLVSKLKAPIQKGGYGLAQAEVLQILNFMPTESVELHLIVDDLQSRMSEEKQDELLAFIAQYVEDDNDKTRPTNGTSNDVHMEGSKTKEETRKNGDTGTYNGNTIMKREKL